MSEEIDDFLAHFGVKGMKWGVVHELDTNGRATAKVDRAQSRQDKREGRAQKFVMKADYAQQGIDEIMAVRATKQGNSIYGDRRLDKLTTVRDRALSDADAKRQGKLTATQKKVLVGAAVTAAIIGAVVLRNNIESGEFNRLALKGQAFLEGKKGFSFKSNPDLAKAMSPDEAFEKVVKHVNPKYGSVGASNNCRRATYAYEMRRRGFDVQATRTTTGYGQSVAGFANVTTPGKPLLSGSKPAVYNRVIREQFKIAEQPDYVSPLTKLANLGPSGARNKIDPVAMGKVTMVSPATIMSTLAKEPSGSRGELAVKWMSGGNHSLAYEIFDGKPVVFDTQTNEKYDNLVSYVTGLSGVSAAGFTRLDNIPLNTEQLGRWVKNA